MWFWQPQNNPLTRHAVRTIQVNQRGSKHDMYNNRYDHNNHTNNYYTLQETKRDNHPQNMPLQVLPGRISNMKVTGH